MSDPVNHPAHYNVGGIEVIDAIDLDREIQRRKREET